MIYVQVDIEKESITFSSSYKEDSVVADYIVGLGFVRKDGIVKFSDLSVYLTYNVNGNDILFLKYPDEGTVIEQTDQEILFYEYLPAIAGSSCVLSIHITNGGTSIKESFSWNTTLTVPSLDELNNIIMEMEDIANDGE